MPAARRRSSLLFDLFATSQQVRSLLTSAMADSGLRPDEYAVYSGIFEFEPIAPTDLAAVVGMPPTTLSHYVRAMRERGDLVERRNPRDGRSRELSLSASGRVAHRRANLAFEEAYRRFIARIGDPEAVKAALGEIEAAARDARGDLALDSTAEAG